MSYQFDGLFCFASCQCLFDPNKGKNEELDLVVFNPLSQDETVSAAHLTCTFDLY